LKAHSTPARFLGQQQAASIRILDPDQRACFLFRALNDGQVESTTLNPQSGRDVARGGKGPVIAWFRQRYRGIYRVRQEVEIAVLEQEFSLEQSLETTHHREGWITTLHDAGG
jgi:hypothetical protein